MGTHVWFWFAASPIWWWSFGLPVGGFSPQVFLWPPTLTTVVAMSVVLVGGALLARRALNF